MENKILNAKKEVFKDIEDSELFKEHLINCEWYYEIKKNHLQER